MKIKERLYEVHLNNLKNNKKSKLLIKTDSLLSLIIKVEKIRKTYLTAATLIEQVVILRE